MKKFDYEYGHKHIQYTHDMLENNILSLKKVYDFVEVKAIGKSEENRKIYILKIGRGERKIFICGGTHGCEWITVPVLMKWLEEICHLYILKDIAYSRSIEELFDKVTIHLLPMVNPDGIDLQIKGVMPGDPNYLNLVKWNNNRSDFSKWKANIRGVDLNRNFKANWEGCKEAEKDEGIQGPHLALYSGQYPESEAESLVLANYTRQENFDLVLSYHTQGEEIYWDFDKIEVEGARELGEKLARASGYTLARPDESAAYGGYKDWFIKEFKRPGYTIECGLGENPLPMTQFDKIYKDNFQLILIAAWGG